MGFSKQEMSSVTTKIPITLFPRHSSLKFKAVYTTTLPHFMEKVLDLRLPETLIFTS